MKKALFLNSAAIALAGKLEVCARVFVAAN